MAISPNKQYLFCAGHQKISLFELTSNNSQPVTTFNAHKGNVIALGFFPGGHWMFSGSDDGSVRIWDLRREPAESQAFEFDTPCTALVLHPNKADLIAAFQNGTVEVLNRARGRSIVQPENSSEEVAIHSLAVHPSGKFLCAVTMKGTVVVYDLEDPVEWKEVKRWKGHSGYILNCSFSPNGNLLATSSSDGTVKLWNVNADFKIVQVLHGHQRWVWDLAFASKSNYLVSVSSDNTARLWDLSQFETVNHYKGHRKAITCVALHDTDEES